MTSFRFSSFILGLFALQAVSATFPNLRGNPDENEDAQHPRALQEISQQSVNIGIPTTSVQVTHVYTTRKHKIRYLCWPGNTGVDAITKYEGRVCADGYNIIWDSMKTVANEQSDEPLHGCQWSRSTDPNWNAEWLGSGCGDSPNSMTLPRNTGEMTVSTYIEIRQHQDTVLCADPGVTTSIKYDGIMCPDDRSRIIYTSMMNVDANGNPTKCTVNGLTAVWSRTDWSHDANFINKYMGSCGVAPTAFPDLRTFA